MDLIDSVEAEDMLELSREIYSTDRLSLVLIGPYDDPDRFAELLRL
ncbi:MAG: hypothetical protein R3A46_21040 [Thermomicrobiales bacterium]